VVTDPYAVLGLTPDADDEAIRRKYLELVRTFTPEQQPEKFAQVRAAYDSLKDLNTRLRRRFLDAHRPDSIDLIIEEFACRSPRRRMSLETLVQTVLAR
jgi:preprotein translocase subunit Sec63